MNRGNLFLSTLLVIVIALSGCRSTKSLDGRAVERQLLESFERWQGTPYRLGGADFNGVDCSAFIMIVYRDQFGVQLPRTTREQINFGERISTRSLRIGDLVFFQTGRNQYHVGILLSKGDFMHASTSSGVMISNLNESYWYRHFHSVRRVL